MSTVKIKGQRGSWFATAKDQKLPIMWGDELYNAGEKTFLKTDWLETARDETESKRAALISYFDASIGEETQIIIATSKDNTNVDDFVDVIYRRFIPNKVVLLRPVDGPEADEIVKVSPFVENQLLIKDQTTVYLCENHVCKLPIREVDKFKALLDGLEKGAKDPK